MTEINLLNWWKDYNEDLHRNISLHTQLLVVGTKICTRDSIFMAFKMSHKCRILLNEMIFVS